MCADLEGVRRLKSAFDRRVSGGVHYCGRVVLLLPPHGPLPLIYGSCGNPNS